MPYYPSFESIGDIKQQIFCLLHHLKFSLISFYRRRFCESKDYFASRKMQVPFSMNIGNEELVHE